MQAYVDIKHQCGRLDGKGGLSPKSIRAHKNIISQALDMAVKNKLIPANPFQFVILPPLVEATFCTDKQPQDLFHALRDDLLVENHLPHIRFRDLRHSCASVLIAMNWSLKDVQEWLGHSDIQMTANTYSHLDVTRKTNIAASLETKFGTASGR